MDYLYILGAFILLVTISTVTVVFSHLINIRNGIVIIVIEIIIIALIFDKVEDISSDHINSESYGARMALELEKLRKERQPVTVLTSNIVCDPETGHYSYTLTKTMGTLDQIKALVQPSR